MTKPVRVAVTGAAGQIGYSLLFRIASSELFGPNTPVRLHLVELPAAIKGAEGTAMELRRLWVLTLDGIEIHDLTRKKASKASTGRSSSAASRVALRMERNDLIRDNGPIFVAKVVHWLVPLPTCVSVVVGNPCNTNALIAQHNCREVPATRFSAMTMLDENRAKAQLAIKAGVIRRPGEEPCHLGQPQLHHGSRLRQRQYRRQGHR